MISAYDVYGANLHKLVPRNTHLVDNNFGWSAMLLNGNVIPEVLDLTGVFNEALTGRRAVHLVFKDQVAIDCFMADTDTSLAQVRSFVEMVRQYRGYLVMTLDELSAGIGYDLNQDVLGNGYSWCTLLNLSVVPERSPDDMKAAKLSDNPVAKKMFLDWNLARFFEDDLFRYFLLNELAVADALRSFSEGDEQSFLRGEEIEYHQGYGGVTFVGRKVDATGLYYIVPDDGSPSFRCNGWDMPYGLKISHRKAGTMFEIPQLVQRAKLPLNWPADDDDGVRYSMVSKRTMPLDVALSMS